MQNADIKLIRFDAADVITTSGDPWFQLTGALVPGCYGQKYAFNKSWVAWDLDSFDTSKTFKLYMYDSGKATVKANDKGYYKILPGATYEGTFKSGETGEMKIYGVEALDGPGAGNKQLEDMSAILTWLEGLAQ